MEFRDPRRNNKLLSKIINTLPKKMREESIVGRFKIKLTKMSISFFLIIKFLFALKYTQFKTYFGYLCVVPNSNKVNAFHFICFTGMMYYFAILFLWNYYYLVRKLFILLYKLLNRNVNIISYI